MALDERRAHTHDGRTATQFRLPLYRPVCTSGSIVCNDTLPVWWVAHRGNILEAVVAAALAQAAQAVGDYVERMERTTPEPLQRLAYAEETVDLRFQRAHSAGFQPGHLLVPRPPEDVGDLWRTQSRAVSSTKRPLDDRSVRPALRRSVRMSDCTRHCGAGLSLSRFDRFNRFWRVLLRSPCFIRCDALFQPITKWCYVWLTTHR